MTGVFHKLREYLRFSRQALPVPVLPPTYRAAPVEPPWCDVFDGPQKDCRACQQDAREAANNPDMMWRGFLAQVIHGMMRERRANRRPPEE